MLLGALNLGAQRDLGQYVQIDRLWSSLPQRLIPSNSRSALVLNAGSRHIRTV